MKPSSEYLTQDKYEENFPPVGTFAWQMRDTSAATRQRVGRTLCAATDFYFMFGCVRTCTGTVHVDIV
ncbi:hypothetical protein EVAR_46183_1 [Eumeta japonica]|uniref:Uncharacterized protein n=1 Tax=Eumeta variegata TaxID=151549 RepID=A0A4C1XZ13_EUMVA|nr:hypothetical protein EVAR_46183_1 [Eumeta japonica]